MKPARSPALVISIFIIIFFNLRGDDFSGDGGVSGVGGENFENDRENARLWRHNHKRREAERKMHPFLEERSDARSW